MSKVKIKKTLEKLTSQLLTLEAATNYAAEVGKEMGLQSTPQRDALKLAARQGRLITAKFGKNYVTNEAAVKDFMKAYDPHNRGRSRPVKNPNAGEKSRRYRERKKAENNDNPANSPETSGAEDTTTQLATVE